MNLTPIQIASRNLVSKLTGVTDPASIDLLLLNPQIESLITHQLFAALDGPFGTVTLGETHGCNARDGADLAFDAIIASLDGHTAMQAHIEAVYDDLFPDEEPEVVTTEQDKIAAALSDLFGFPVKLVRLEPAAG